MRHIQVPHKVKVSMIAARAQIIINARMFMVASDLRGDIFQEDLNRD